MSEHNYSEHKIKKNPGMVHQNRMNNINNTIFVEGSLLGNKYKLIGHALQEHIHGRIQGRDRGSEPHPPEQSQVAICFLRKTGTDHLEK